jgi:hypothetical protein
MMTTRLPWHAYLILLRPRRILRNLEAIARAGIVRRVPNLWQIELGVLRMWYRILFRPNTIGRCANFEARDNWRARFFEPRPIRFPFLLWEGSVRPWDLSGMLSTPEELQRHLLGTHHDGEQFVYDLEILALHPGKLEALRDEAKAVVENDNPRSRWLRDLCVYENYHENLLRFVEERIEQGQLSARPDDRISTELSADADVYFSAHLDWCATQPETPRETLRALRAGTFSFAPGSGEPGPSAGRS